MNAGETADATAAGAAITGADERAAVADPGLRRNLVTGVAWKLLGHGFAQVTRSVVGVILARLLSPADFGLAAIALIYIGVTGIFTDLALGAAIVQRKVVSEEDPLDRLLDDRDRRVGADPHRRRGLAADRRRALGAQGGTADRRHLHDGLPVVPRSHADRAPDEGAALPQPRAQELRRRLDGRGGGDPGCAGRLRAVGDRPAGRRRQRDLGGTRLGAVVVAPPLHLLRRQPARPRVVRLQDRLRAVPRLPQPLRRQHADRPLPRLGRARHLLRRLQRHVRARDAGRAADPGRRLRGLRQAPGGTGAPPPGLAARHGGRVVAERGGVPRDGRRRAGLRPGRARPQVGSLDPGAAAPQPRRGRCRASRRSTGRRSRRSAAPAPRCACASSPYPP